MDLKNLFKFSGDGKSPISRADKPLGIIVATIVVACLGLFVIYKMVTPIGRAICKTLLTDSATQMMERESQEATVEAEVAKPGKVSRRLVTVGKLRANNDVMIKSEIHGRVTEILFEEGRSVQKDDILIKFDDADSQAKLKQAEASLAQYTADLERISSLYSKNIESTKKLDEIRANKLKAEAEVEAAKAELSKRTIRAPFEGKIGLINISAGAYVQANTDLVKLVDLTPIKIDFKVPEKNIHDIGAGQIAEIRLDGFKDQIFRFNVDAVDSKVDEQSHSIALRASYANDGELLRPGLFANVSLIVGEKNDAITVPESAVFRQGEIEFVWIIHKGRATRKQVITGTRESGRIEVLPGYLPPGIMIITAGQIRLTEGKIVRVSNIPELSGEPSAAAEKKAANETSDGKQDKEKGSS